MKNIFPAIFPAIFLTGTSLSFLACSDNDTASDEPFENDFTLKICEIDHEDAYSIADIEFVDDIMNITVSYSGGCGSHEWQLCWNGLVAESYPVQISMELGHNSNGDTCEMEKVETLSFDISSMADVEQPTQVHIGDQSVYRGDVP